MVSSGTARVKFYIPYRISAQREHCFSAILEFINKSLRVSKLGELRLFGLNVADSGHKICEIRFFEEKLLVSEHNYACQY